MGVKLRRKVVDVLTTNAATLFSEQERYTATQEVLAGIPNAVRNLTRLLASVSYRQQATITQLFAMSSQDNATILQLQSTNTQLMANNASLTTANTALSTKPAPVTGMLVPFTPHTNNIIPGSITKWYKCPNCDTVFSRCISLGVRYAHSCYSAGYMGRRGRSDMILAGPEWDQYGWK